MIDHGIKHNTFGCHRAHGPKAESYGFSANIIQDLRTFFERAGINRETIEAAESAAVPRASTPSPAV